MDYSEDYIKVRRAGNSLHFMITAKIKGVFMAWDNYMTQDEAVAFAVGVRDEALSARHYMQLILPEGAKIEVPLVYRYKTLSKTEAVQ